ncbi:putative ribonuclease H-like domain-containing protein [Tanacetum coccineum]|uniref:Ribonuclease H-like domain-containing protein n=1 Tax=Tanacetum coccineum TaxID=301880 RepID=A0ABQ5FXZ7_9ASTR
MIVIKQADDSADESYVQKPASENEQALKNVLDKMMDQEKEATKQSDAVRKEFEAQLPTGAFQGKATKASSTNNFNTVSTPVNAASASRTSNDTGPSSVPLGRSFPLNFNDLPDDPFIPDLEDTAEVQNTLKALDVEAGLSNDQEELLLFKIEEARLVPQGYKQEEGIDYDEVFAPVARIEVIKLFLAHASFMNFLVYQMDVKSAFLYGTIEEEVYVSQPPGFVDLEFLEKVYKVEKALYGLHQAPKAWYETLSTYLLDNGFYRGQIDKTFFIKRVKGDILLVHVYVDDIIFGSTKKSLCTNFEQIIHKRFQTSSMGELTFFLGLQVKQKEDEIFISQDKYVSEILKKFGFSTIRTANTPMETNKALTKDEDGEDVDVHLYRSMIRSLMYLTSSRPDIMFSVCACSRFQVQSKVSHLNAVKRIFRYLKGRPKLGLWYPKDSPFILEAFSDSDYTGASLDRKSTTGAEYIAASYCCGQVLWIQNQMLDYGYNFMQTKIHVDNESAICVVKNPVYHSKTKHIEIRHHFIRDSYEKSLIEIVKIHTDNNVADLLTKAFDGRLMVFKCSGVYTSAIWIQVRRRTKKDTKLPQTSVPQDLGADEAVHKEGVTVWKGLSLLEWIQVAVPGVKTPWGVLLLRLGMMEYQFELTANVSITPHDSPLSGGYTPRSDEGRMKLQELMTMCTKLSKHVLDLETEKDAQAVAIL